MDGLKDCRAVADICTWGHAQAANKPGDQIGQDVAEKIGAKEHVELPRVQDQLHRAGIDDSLVHLDPAGVSLADLSRRLQKDTRQRLHDVGLVDDGHLLSAVFQRVVEGKLSNAAAAMSGVHAGTDRDGVRVVADGDEVLEADIQAFEVLPNEHEVDVFESASGNHRLRRPDVREELKLLAKAYVR